MNWSGTFFAVALGLGLTRPGAAATSEFAAGTAAYARGDFMQAREQFVALTTLHPSANVWRNLGNAHWELGETAAAILAWERAASLNPLDAVVDNNLRFARRAAQLEAPDLTWYEIASTWLPLNWWAGVGMVSFWFAAALGLLPVVLGGRKSAGQQAGVALGLGVFLLSLPANYGAGTRAQWAVVVARDTLLRLTPTNEAEAQTRLAAGEPVRWVRSRGDYVLVAARRTTGWVRQEEIERILRPPGEH